MRDDTQRWSPPLWSHPESILPLQAAHVHIAPVHLQRQAIVSGVTVLAQADTVSWPEINDQSQYRVCLRRDRVLCVNGEPRADGWNADTKEAYSDMSCAYRVLDISGRDALKVLQRGTEIFLEEPSRSCVRQLFGYEVIVYRVQASTFRLHVSSAEVESMWSHLHESIQQLNDDLNQPPAPVQRLD